MSHTDHELMRELVAMIRSVEEEVGRPIGILADLQGPKLRVGKFADGSVTLNKGDTFTLDPTSDARRHRARLSAASGNPAIVEPGQRC